LPWVVLAVAASLAVLGAVALATWLRFESAPLQSTPPTASKAAKPSTSASRIGLPPLTRGPVSAAVGASDPAFFASAVVGGFAADSSAQRLHARFRRDGVTLRSGPVQARMLLVSAGSEGSVRQLPELRPSAASNRVDYRREGLDEWYLNGPLGIEQGFTFEHAPSPDGASAGELTLALSLELSAGTRASLSNDADAVLLSHGGVPILRYGRLSAHDVGGRTLPSHLALHDGRLLMEVDASNARYPLTIDPLIEQADRPAPSDEAGDGQFGFSVALSADGSTALIGAPGDDHFAGAAWVFTRTGSVWTQQGSKLSVNEQTDADEEARCEQEINECGFGRSVALSADGSTALIGAPRANDAHGAAWVFTRSGTDWSQFGEKLTGSFETKGNGSFGRSVALSADGDTALVGAPRDGGSRGAAWVFTRSASSFAQEGAELLGGGELGTGYFGRSVALSSDGQTAIIGGPGDDDYAGAAWTFARAGESWLQQGAKLQGGPEELGPGRFGFSVALDAEGGTALIGARSDNEKSGGAWVLARTGSTWAQQGSKLSAGAQPGEAQFGYSTALSADGAIALIGAPHDDASAGAAWIYARSGDQWTRQQEQQPGAEEGKVELGASVALSADGGTALVGAPHAGRRLGGVWAYLGPPSATPEQPLPVQSPPEGPPPPNEEGPAGSSLSPAARSGVLGSIATGLPAPKLALTGNVIRLSGTVRIRLPGSHTFTLLSEGEQIPFGSIVDATHGRVSVTTATPGGGTQTMVFYEGEFKLTQRRDGLVVSILTGGSFSGCRTARAHPLAARSSSSRKRPVRKLWAEGHGSYSTKGNYATGAVLGTRWLTEDLCGGTLIRVLTDRVAVTNLLTHRRLTVTAGHSYLAKVRRSHAKR
jgi:hypothetical protein